MGGHRVKCLYLSPRDTRSQGITGKFYATISSFVESLSQVVTPWKGQRFLSLQDGLRPVTELNFLKRRSMSTTEGTSEPRGRDSTLLKTRLRAHRGSGGETETLWLQWQKGPALLPWVSRVLPVLGADAFARRKGTFAQDQSSRAPRGRLGTATVVFFVNTGSNLTQITHQCQQASLYPFGVPDVRRPAGIRQ